MSFVGTGFKASNSKLQPPNQKSFLSLESQTNWPDLASKLFPEVEVINKYFILFWMTIHQPGHISLKLKPQITICPMHSPAKTWPPSNQLNSINREALMIHPLPQNYFSILVVGSDVESLRIWYKWPTHSQGEITCSLARTGSQCLWEWFTFGQNICSLHHTGKDSRVLLLHKRGTWVHRTILGHEWSGPKYLNLCNWTIRKEAITSKLSLHTSRMPVQLLHPNHKNMSDQKHTAKERPWQLKAMPNYL